MIPRRTHFFSPKSQKVLMIPRRTHFRLSKKSKKISAYDTEAYAFPVLQKIQKISAQDMRKDEPQGKAREAYVRSITSASRTRDGRQPPYANSYTPTRITHRKDMGLQRTSISTCRSWVV